MRTEQDLLKVVNASGFPLQIGVERLVLDATGFDWRVRYTEHRWDHPRTQANGHIDIVLQHRSLPAFVVVECKRVQTSEWTFLRRRGSADVDRSKVMIRYHAATRGLTGWEDVAVRLSSAVSGFCVLPGEDNSKTRPMLERLASDVVTSVEGLVHEDEKHGLHKPNTPYTYIAMIVTTADLKLCDYDESKIKLATGVFGDAAISDIIASQATQRYVRLGSVTPKGKPRRRP